MKSTPSRLLYIDNMRTLVITLVVLVHISLTYGPVGPWYYYERTELPSTYPLGFFVSFNQAFYMGLFFMIAAYFILPSYSRKGAVLERPQRHEHDPCLAEIPQQANNVHRPTPPSNRGSQPYPRSRSASQQAERGAYPDNPTAG